MAATGKTPILLYGSTTATNTPSAGNLTNSSDGCEIAINVADKNLFFKDSTNVVNTVPIRQSGTSSNGWLSSTDWNTFNNKQPAGTYVTSVTGTAPVVSSGGTTPAISMAAATGSVNGYLTSTDWTTFNNKQAALVSGTNIKTVNGTSLLGSGDVGTIDVAHGGTGATTLTSGYFLQGNGTSAVSTSTKLYTDGSNLFSDCYHKVIVQSGATANTAPTGLIVSNKTTGSAATGFGSALEFNYQDTSGGYSGGKIASLAGADIFTADMVFYPRNYGYAEAGRFKADGNFSLVNNLVIGTSGKGIDFSATAGTGTSELLADYEEGTWTPTLTNWTGSMASYVCYYTKIGRLVQVWGVLVPTTTFATTVASSYVSGLPYNPVSDGPPIVWSTAYTGQLPSIVVSNRLYVPTVSATSASFYFSCTYTV